MSSNKTVAVVVGAVLAVVAVVIGVVALAGGGDDSERSSATTVAVAASSGRGSDATTAGSGASTDGTAAADGTTAPSVTASSEDLQADPLAARVTVVGDALVELPQTGADPAVGKPAPELVGTNYDGEPVSIAAGADGKATLVVFLAHWCPHCNREIPVLNQWRESGDVPDGLRVVAVSTAVDDSAPNYPPGKWLTDAGWQWDVIADDSSYAAAKAFGVSGFPFFVLVDADGNVVQRGSGEQSIDELNAIASQI